MLRVRQCALRVRWHAAAAAAALHCAALHPLLPALPRRHVAHTPRPACRARATPAQFLSLLLAAPDSEVVGATLKALAACVRKSGSPTTR